MDDETQEVQIDEKEKGTRDTETDGIPAIVLPKYTKGELVLTPTQKN